MTSVLFRPAEHGWRNPGRVMLNWSRDPIKDLEWISESYQKIAKQAVDDLKRHRWPLRGSGCFDAYPIVFLYRQAFELMLKAIVFAGAVALREEGEEPMSLKQIMRHELTPLFREVSRIFGTMTDEESDVWNFAIPELRTRSDFETIVKEFDRVDPGSYTFRYSVKKDGATPSLDAGFEFDLFAFAEMMDRIIPVLSAAPEWIRESLQDRWQAAYEEQVEAWRNADPSDYYENVGYGDE